MRSLSPPQLPLYYCPPPHPPSFTGLLSHDAADYSIDLFKGLHFMIMNFTVLRQYVSCTATQLHHLHLLLLLFVIYTQHQ